MLKNDPDLCWIIILRFIMDALKGLPAYYNLWNDTKLGISDLEFLMLNVPPVCNYRCEKCFTSVANNNVKNSLTTSEIINVIDKAQEKGVRCVSILGEGEPLLFLEKMAKDVNYKEIIEYINAKGLVTLIATNGLLLNKKNVDFLYKNNVSIAISLDTLDRNEYKKYYRGSANLDKVLKNIEYARSVYKNDIYEFNGKVIKRLCIHMTVTSKNYMNMPAIMELCGEDIYFDCEHIAQVGIANENPEIYKGYQACIEACNSVKNAMVRTYIPALDKEMCCYLYYGFAVTHDGEVLVDTHALDTKYAVGNIRNKDIDELISKSRELRDKYIEKFDCHYCIIRSEKYQDYINSLKTI